MSRLGAFAIGLSAGFLLGAGAMAIINARPRSTNALEVAPMDTVEPAKPTLPEPFSGYTTMPIQTIRESLRALSLADREAVRVYEEATLKRKGILNVLRALEEERVNGNA